MKNRAPSRPSSPPDLGPIVSDGPKSLSGIPCLPAGITRFVALALFLLLSAGSANGQLLSVEETERLVRASYFEGMPEDQAARIGRAGAARLVEMLADSDEKPNHARIIIALGACGSPDALAAIRDWTLIPRSGEIDRDTFKAWQALPYALGHLAPYDARALPELEALMTAETPSWTFGHHNGPRLVRLRRQSAATALALTGLPEAARALDRASQISSDAEFSKHLRDARTLHRGRAREVSN